MKTYLIGIDPSFKTAGVAVYHPESGRMVLHTGDLFSVIGFLNKSQVLRKSIIVLENPNLDSTFFGGWGRFRAQLDRLVKRQIGVGDIQSEFRIAFTQAQHVGKSKAAGELFLELFTRQGIPVIEIAPSTRHRADKDLRKVGVQGIKMLVMPTKTTAEQFKALTGFDGRCSEHARDAATMIHGRTIRWAEMMLQRKSEQ